MTSRQLKKFTPMLPVALLFLLGLWLLFAGKDYLPILRGFIRQERNDIARFKNQIETMTADNQKLANELSGLIVMRSRSMNQSDQSAIEIFRERVDKAVAGAGLRSRSLSGIRRTELSGKCLLFEVSIAVDGQIDEVIKFLDNLYREKPQLYWRSINIKPDNLTKPEYLTVSGTLCALSFVGYVPEEDEFTQAQEQEATTAPATPEAAP